MSQITLELQNDSPLNVTADEVQQDVTFRLTGLEGLSPEDQTQVEHLMACIDLHGDTAALMLYGQPLQNRLKIYTSNMLKQAVSRNIGEIDALLSEMVGVIKEFDSDIARRFRSVFRTARSREALLESYEKTTRSLRKVRAGLYGWVIGLLAATSQLDEMYREVLDCYKRLTLYLEAGKRKLGATKNELEELKCRAESDPTSEAALLYRDSCGKCADFERRLESLATTKSAFLQVATQVELTQRIDRGAIHAIRDGLDNAIPLWMNGAAAALTAEQAKEMLKMQNSELLAAVEKSSELKNEWQRRRSEMDSN